MTDQVRPSGNPGRLGVDRETIFPTISDDVKGTEQRWIDKARKKLGVDRVMNERNPRNAVRGIGPLGPLAPFQVMPLMLDYQMRIIPGFENYVDHIEFEA